MAKIKNIILCSLLVLYCGTGCVLRANLGDTDALPTTEVVDPIPYENVDGIDTVSVKVQVVEAEISSEPDTVKKSIVIGPVVVTSEMKRAAVQRAYTSYIGKTESTGRNDGPWLKPILASVGLREGQPYCAAGVHFCLEKGGVPNKVTGWSPTSVNFNNLVWADRKFKKKPRVGDVISIYYAGLGRIGHTGFWDKEVNDTYYESVEFNTNSQDSREGNGVFRRKKSYNATKYISDHIGG